MAYESEFQEVKNAPPESKLAAFAEYCDRMIARRASGELSDMEVAYRICGTSFQLSEIKGEHEATVDAILNQACDLELPAEHRSAGSSWEELINQIGNLPRNPSKK